MGKSSLNMDFQCTEYFLEVHSKHDTIGYAPQVRSGLSPFSILHDANKQIIEYLHLKW